MNRPLIIGLITEGSTDTRFLKSIITRTFEDIIINESRELPEIYDIQEMERINGTFTEKIVYAAKAAEENGIMILCVHADADDKTDSDALQYRINPAFAEVAKIVEPSCKNLVSIIPIYMTEAWMLSDLSLLKEELLTNKSNETLQLIKQPESYSDPKNAIKNAINIVQIDMPNKRRRYEVKISDLYLPIGQKIKLQNLRRLSSYEKFRENAKFALNNLNFFH